jgi:hypothetical protein
MTDETLIWTTRILDEFAKFAMVHLVDTDPEYEGCFREEYESLPPAILISGRALGKYLAPEAIGVRPYRKIESRELPFTRS